MPYYARRHQLQGNLLYHVFNRANSKSRIFHNEKDFLYFKSLLSKYSAMRNMKIYHWVIMLNHYHLLLELEIPEALSSIMAGINRLYTIYHHKAYNTVGYLWQGRFKSQPIQKDRYMLACGRYIERNSVKKNLVTCAEDYPYSSTKYYVYGLNDNLTAKDPLYSIFGKNISDQQKAYKEFLLNFESQEEEIFDKLEVPLGDKSFKNKLIKKKGHYFPMRKGRVRNSIFVS